MQPSAGSIITPTPSTETLEQLQLMHQIQQHLLTNNQGFLLYAAMSIPLPISWRLILYHFFMTLPIPPLSPMEITILVVLGPFALILFLFILVKLLLWFSRTVVPFIFERFFDKPQENSFLELTFPHDTSKSAYATEQLYKLIHAVGSLQRGIFTPKKTYSLEVVSTLEHGIRYIISIPQSDVAVLRKSLMSYLPGLTVKEIRDYLSENRIFNKTLTTSQIEERIKTEKSVGVLEFKLTNDFALPLRDQKKLGIHDSISFLTGNMTKPKQGETISFQIVLNPVLGSNVKRRMQEVKRTIYQAEPLSPVLNNGLLSGIIPSGLLLILSPILWLITFLVRLLIYLPFLLLAPNGPHSKKYFSSEEKIPAQMLLNPYEQELTSIVKEKLSQHLFTCSIRCLIETQNEEDFDTRQTGLISSFGQFSSEYQSLTIKSQIAIPFISNRIFRKRVTDFYQRNVSSGPAILSASELSDLYHFPNMDITKIEGLSKSKSYQLPAPISMKGDSDGLDVIVGRNTYGGESTPVGLRKQDRRQQTYIVGKTGMGKSTIIEGMAIQDMQNNKGLAVVDPHGDMVEHLLTIIPKFRQKDVIYLSPFDKQFPIGLNILNPGTVYSDPEEEMRRIAGIVMSIFMKITPPKHWGQRMEHILRNAVLTMLQVPTGTSDTPFVSFYSIQKLLTDSSYRKIISGKLRDPILKQFWEKEYALFTKNKQGDLISPLTNKIGEFITDPLSRFILLQKESTVNMSEIMDQGKILLVNLSKGNLGEERSAFFGTIITSLIQLATYARTQIPEEQRRDFFVYVDEFQNFATPHFTELFSESRKYRVFFTPSHQNIAQIDDLKLAKIIQGNSGNFIALKESPDDERTLLPLFSPEVKEGQIVNLAPYHFFMKITNAESEDAFSAETIPVDLQGSESIKDAVIENSRRYYATPREDVEKQLDELFKTSSLSVKKTQKKGTRKVITTKTIGRKHKVQNTKTQIV
ncbi:MAG: type IV secretory system conjugative DNA transfer family protein [Candidatus Levyibacteriota bacterium]